MFGLMLAQVSGAWGSAFGSGTNKSVLHYIFEYLFPRAVSSFLVELWLKNTNNNFGFSFFFDGF